MFVCIFDFVGIFFALIFDKSYASGGCPQILNDNSTIRSMNER